MSKKTKKQDEQTIMIDDKSYLVSDLTESQIQMVNHVSDLSNKEKSMAFNLAQIQGGRNYFMELLKGSLG
jgi:hypothetical protein